MNKILYFKKAYGFSTIEIMLASSLFLLVITGMMGSLTYIREQQIEAKREIEAIYLAKEGIEAARNIRSQSFDLLENGEWGFEIIDEKYTLKDGEYSTDNPNLTGKISISEINPETKEVRSTVSWTNRFGSEKNVELTTQLTDWQLYEE